MNIASSKLIWGHGGRFDGGGWVVRYRGVIKEKSPDFRSPEVGISVSIISGRDSQSVTFGSLRNHDDGIGRRNIKVRS